MSFSSSTAVRWGQDLRSAFYEVDSVQGSWNSDTVYEEGNKGHRPGIKGGYFPVPPVDAFQDIRAAMCKACEEMGLVVEVHHHEVATGGAERDRHRGQHAGEEGR